MIKTYLRGLQVIALKFLKSSCLAKNNCRENAKNFAELYILTIYIKLYVCVYISGRHSNHGKEGNILSGIPSSIVS